MPEPTHCLDRAEGAKSGDFEPERSGLGSTRNRATSKQKVAGSRPVPRSTHSVCEIGPGVLTGGLVSDLREIRETLCEHLRASRRRWWDRSVDIGTVRVGAVAIAAGLVGKGQAG